MRVKSLGKVIVTSAGTPVSIGSTIAGIMGTEVEPFAIVLNVNDQMLISVDGGASQPVTFTAGATRSAANIVSDINSQTTGLTASDVAGQVYIQSNTTGSLSSLQIEAVNEDAYAALGFSVGTTSGSDGERCCKIRITPIKANAGDLYVGNSATFDTTTGIGFIGYILKPVASPASLDVFEIASSTESNNMNSGDLYLDAASSNDGAFVAIWIA